MRYLKVTAQDRSANGKADTVLLHFFEESSGAEDRLIHKAYALDITADGKVDFQVGDVNNDGKENTKDERLLKSFANAYLQLDWFNRRCASSTAAFSGMLSSSKSISPSFAWSPRLTCSF